MPELSRFYGIVITMNYREHNPPHFHANFNEYEISVDIRTGIIKGSMPRKEIRRIFMWLDDHKEELLKNWGLCEERRTLIKIEPL